MLDTPRLLFIISFVALIISPFIFMISKSYYHFEYLKRVNPEKFKKYKNYFDTYNNFEFFNQYRVILLFPFFKRLPEQEETEEMNRLAKKVKLFCKLLYYDLAVIAVYVVSLIVIFGNFN